MFKILLTALLIAGCGRLFNDPYPEENLGAQEELLPAPLPPVKRLNLLESFGHFECSSCPAAESRLSPAVHASLDSSRLLIVNFHVRYGSNTDDEWITPGTQAVADAYGYSIALPQVKLNGSNAPFGFSESNIHYDNYAALIASLGTRDSLTPLELTFDSASLRYDTAAFTLSFNFSAANRDTPSITGLSFRVLAAKNAPVVFSLRSDPWEVIVVEAVATDKSGNGLTAPVLRGLTRKTWQIEMTLGDEAAKHQGRAGWGLPVGKVEKSSDYALVVAAILSDGRLENALRFHYRPELP